RHGPRDGRRNPGVGSGSEEAGERAAQSGVGGEICEGNRIVQGGVGKRALARASPSQGVRSCSRFLIRSNSAFVLSSWSFNAFISFCISSSRSCAFCASANR